MNFLRISLWMLCVYCLKKTEQCSPPQGWSPMKPEKRAEKAKIVVFGTVVSIPKHSHSSGAQGRFYTVQLHVHCIVKGPQLSPYINVAGFSEFSGGLCVHSNAFQNKTYVMFIERNDHIPGDGFRVLEVNLQKGAFHPGHKLSLLRDIMSVTGENGTLPTGVKNDSLPGCPVVTLKRKPFQDPARIKPKRPCRCRRKKQKRKKRKRTKTKSRARNRVSLRNITELPTLPRTRRYNVINYKHDTEPKESMLWPPSRGETLSNSSRKLVAHWLWSLLILPHVVIRLLPT